MLLGCKYIWYIPANITCFIYKPASISTNLLSLLYNLFSQINYFTYLRLASKSGWLSFIFLFLFLHHICDCLLYICWCVYNCFFAEVCRRLRHVNFVAVFPTAGVAVRSENSDSADDLSWEVLNCSPKTFLIAGSFLFHSNDSPMIHQVCFVMAQRMINSTKSANDDPDDSHLYIRSLIEIWLQKPNLIPNRLIVERLISLTNQKHFITGLYPSTNWPPVNGGQNSIGNWVFKRNLFPNEKKN